MLLYFTQFMREFGRVVENPETRKKARSQWEYWVPRVLAVAKKESNVAVTQLLHEFESEGEDEEDKGIEWIKVVFLEN